MKLRNSALLVALSLSAATFSMAQSSIRPDALAGHPDASNESSGQPAQVMRQGEIAYVHGGISDSGQQRVHRLAQDMNLKLVFANLEGQYVADVDVAIADANGRRLLDVDSADPLFFAQLPPGDYNVTATFNGQAVRRKVSVPQQGLATEQFAWSTRATDEPPAQTTAPRR